MNKEDILMCQEFPGLFFPKRLKCQYNGLFEVFVDYDDVQQARSGGVMPVGYCPPGMCYSQHDPIGVYVWTGNGYRLKYVFFPKIKKQ